MNDDNNQFSLVRAASKKQIPISISSKLFSAVGACPLWQRLLLFTALIPALTESPPLTTFHYDGRPLRELVWLLVLGWALLAVLLESGKKKETGGLFEWPAGLRLVVISGGLFALWAGASAAWSPAAFWAWRYAGGWLGGLVFLWLLVAAFREETFRNLFWGLVLAVFSAMCGIHIARKFGTVGSGFFDLNTLHAAEWLATLTPVFAGLYLLHPRRRWQLAGLMSCFLGYWALLQTGRRAPLFGVVAGLALALALLWLLRPRDGRRRADGAGEPLWRKAGWLILLLEALTLAHVQPSIFNLRKGEDGKELIGDRFTSQQVASGLLPRFQCWAACWEMWRDNPVAGRGGESFRPDYYHYRARYIQAGQPWGQLSDLDVLVALRAHNEYVQVLGELGVIGLGLFLAFIGSSLALPLRGVWSILGGKESSDATFAPCPPELGNAQLALFAVGGMCGFYISAATSSFGFRSLMTAWGFWVVLALALVLAPATAGASKPASGLEPAPSPRWARVGLTALLLATGWLWWHSLGIWFGEFHLNSYCATTNPASLRQALAWFPQHPGVHWHLARHEIGQLLRVRASLETAQTTGSLGAVSPLELRQMIARVFDPKMINSTVRHLDEAARNGVAFSLIPALKALAAEVVFQPELAQATLEAALDDYPDSPFLAAYYAYLSGQLGRPAAATTQRIALVIRFQPTQFSFWQSYFHQGLKVVGKDQMNFALRDGGREGTYLPYFGPFYGRLRETNSETGGPETPPKNPLPNP